MKLGGKEERGNLPAQVVKEQQEWEYHSKSKDCLSEDTKTTLTAYTPPDDLITMLENNIDTNLE